MSYSYLEVKMRKKMSIFLSVALFLFLSCQTKATTDIGQIETKIQMATKYLLGPAGPGEDAKEGFKLLVAAIEMASLEAEFPSEFREKISEARGLFESNSIFDQKGIDLLNESYFLVNDGVGFQMPESISSIEQAVEYARQQIDSARENLKKGEVGECARGLLEVALIVVTPMIQK